MSMYKDLGYDIRASRGTGSKKLLKITGTEIVDEARMPTEDVILRARDLQWNWLWHILRMDDRQTVRQVLLTWVKPTPESVAGDLIDSNIKTVKDLAKDRIEWKRICP